jgi:hypothetical protein
VPTNRDHVDPWGPVRVRDRASALVLVVVAITFAALLAAGVGRLGIASVDAARAEQAADAAALAGVMGGRPAAADLAARNGAELISFTRDGDDVLVVVVRHGIERAARATDGP